MDITWGMWTKRGGEIQEKVEGVDVTCEITAGGGIREEVEGVDDTCVTWGVSTEEGGGFWQESEDPWGVTAKVEGVLLWGAAENDAKTMDTSGSCTPPVLLLLRRPLAPASACLFLEFWEAELAAAEGSGSTTTAFQTRDFVFTVTFSPVCSAPVALLSLRTLERLSTYSFPS